MSSCMTRCLLFDGMYVGSDKSEAFNGALGRWHSKSLGVVFAWLSVPIFRLDTVSFTPTPAHRTMNYLAKWTVPDKEKALPAFVGYANLPNQVFRKAVKRGFQFTLMVVGQSGLGKSTLLNSLFMTDLYEDSAYEGSPYRIPKTIEIRTSTVHMQEGGVHLELTLVDTPGFGDVINNVDCWSPILNFIDKKYEDYLNEESRVSRNQLEDYRVHCCMYFIPPNGHGLRQIDIEFMKKLHEKVNIVPVIAKADTFTPEECLKFKKKVLQDIQNNQIKIYDFPDGEGDAEEIAANRKMKEAIPFAVVGSNTIIEVNNKKMRGADVPMGCGRGGEH
eukprot:Em0018g384a